MTSIDKRVKMVDEGPANVIRIGDYQYEEKDQNCLGTGSFGQVWKGIRITDKHPVAIKKVPVPKISPTELKILVAVKHPNLLELFECRGQYGHLFIITELCTCDLEYFLRAIGGKLTGENLKTATKHLAGGYGALYAKHIIHRDIKPQNILVLRQGDNIMLKISDFGCGKFLEQNFTSTVIGTILYFAPEIGAGLALGSEKVKYDARADIWGIGLVLYECATGKFPYDKRTLFLMFNAVAEESTDEEGQFRPEIPSDISPDMKNMLTAMLTFYYPKRMKPEELVFHPYIAGNIRDSIDVRKEQRTTKGPPSTNELSMDSLYLTSRENMQDNMETLMRLEAKETLQTLITRYEAPLGAETDNRLHFVREEMQTMIKEFDDYGEDHIIKV